MRGDAPRTIVVGVDGSEPSERALRWALDEAPRRRARVVAVHVWLYPSILPPHVDGKPPPAYEQLREAAEELLDAAVAAVADDAAGVEVEQVVCEGCAAEALVAAAADADLLVVGSRGIGGFAELLLGSVSQQCAHHARCPVVIVRSDPVGAGRPTAAAAR